MSTCFFILQQREQVSVSAYSILRVSALAEKSKSFINCCYDHERCTKLGRELVVLQWRLGSATHFVFTHFVGTFTRHTQRYFTHLFSPGCAVVGRKLGHSRRCSPEEDGFMAVYTLVCNALNAEITEETETRNGLG